MPLIFKQRVEFKPFQAPGAVSPPSPPSSIPHHWPCFQIHPGSAPPLFCIAEAWPLNFIFPRDPWPPGFSLGWPTGAQVAGKVSPWHQSSPGSLRTATSLRVLLALGVLISSPPSVWLFLSANDFDKCPDHTLLSQLLWTVFPTRHWLKYPLPPSSSTHTYPLIPPDAPRSEDATSSSPETCISPENTTFWTALQTGPLSNDPQRMSSISWFMMFRQKTSAEAHTSIFSTHPGVSSILTFKTIYQFYWELVQGTFLALLWGYFHLGASCDALSSFSLHILTS